jgi:hypothetical protein
MYYGNDGQPYSVSHVDCHVIVRNSVDSIFVILSGIHPLVGNSNVYTQEFSPVKLPTQNSNVYTQEFSPVKLPAQNSNVYTQEFSPVKLPTHGS